MAPSDPHLRMSRLGFVVATYHGPLIEEMVQQASDRAAELNASVAATHEVTGVYDTVLPADRLARREDIDAVVVIGAIITGETRHDAVIGHAVAMNLQRVSLEQDTPVTLGITGPGMDADEARDRVDYAASAVEAAVELVTELDD